MNCISDRDHKLHDCTAIDLDDKRRFPDVSEEVFYEMEQELYSDTEHIHLFPFVQKNENDEAYVVIYVWDIARYPLNCTRFVIYEGTPLPKASEEEFLNYIHSKQLEIEVNRFHEMDKKVCELFPSIHYPGYSATKSRIALEHVYFANHRCTREILYKADLNYIAYELDIIKDWNPAGTDPESIIGHGLPIRLLRILNRPAFVLYFLDDFELEHSLGVYRTFSDYIGEALPTGAQWVYLEKLYDHGPLGKREFRRSLYRMLSQTNDYSVVDQYETFFKCRKELNSIYRIKKMPPPLAIGDVVEKLERIIEYKNDSELNELINGRYQKEHGEYEFTEGEYMVMMPATTCDICREALSQGNCLTDYIDGHAFGKTTILFLRKKDHPEDSYVTVEIKNWIIEQVYAAQNEFPPVDAYRFLISYARKHWLLCNPYKLIIQNTYAYDHDVFIGDELRYFAESYEPESILSEVDLYDPDNPPYVQMTLWECFPEVGKS